jgi:PAS domain S-box-containing protein
MVQPRKADRRHALDRSAPEFFAEHASDVMVWAGPDGRIQYVSPSVRRYGYEPAELIGTDGVALFHPDDRSRFIENTAALLRGDLQAGANRRHRLGTRLGDWVCVEGSPRPIFDSDGRPLGFLNIFRDVTEQDRLEQAAREQQDLFGAVFEQSAIGKVLIGMDGRIMRVNRSLCRALGYAPDEVIGRSDDDFAHPDEIGRFADQFSAVARGEIQSYQAERRYRARSGSWIWFSLTVSMARDADGSPRAIVAELQDLTERRAAEQGIAESEARYRMVVDRISDIIVRYDQHHVIEFVSPSVRQLGYEPEDMIGRNMADFGHPDDRGANLEGRTDLLQGNAEREGLDNEFRARRADGKWAWFEANRTPVRDETGKVIAVVSAQRDVTARREMEEELRRKRAEAEAAAIAKSEFLANMSHEIRTPLTAIVGYAQLLAKRDELSPTAANFASRVETASHSLLNLVNDILDFSRIEAGQIELDPHAFDPAALVAEAADLIAGQASAKGLDLKIDVSTMPAAVLADGSRVRQVLLNLLSNAVKFTDSGAVTVSARHEAGRLCISVADSGVGIAKDRLDRLFQRFSQADNSITRKYGGTGLGLAICKRLTEMMGGQIEFESREGEGSTFRFAVDAPPAELEPAAAPAEPELGLAAGRILVVDDVSMNLELVRTMLSPFGFDIEEASGGAEAVAAALGGAFDLILMDLQMPGMDGLSATRAIRQTSEANRATPILALSANVLPEHHAACREAGMDDHIAKPISPAELITKIAAWTATRQAPGR